MANLLDPVITKLLDLGVYDILVFVVVTAIFYGFLRKSKLLGGSTVVNGVLALSIGFLVLGFKWITGMALTSPLSIFFTQATVILLLFIFGFLAASMFYPDLLKWLPQVFKTRGMLTIMIVLGFALVITSGLITTLWTVPTPEPGVDGVVGPPMDIVIVAAGLIIFVVMLIIATSAAGG